MAIRVRGAQPSGAGRLVQAGLRTKCAVWAAPGAALLLSGCSLHSYNPVNWWHSEEGGKIAEQRPAPPGAQAPYPNLATVPARPEPPDKEAMKKLTDSLLADRANAHYTAESAPLPDPSSPAASPSLFGVGSLPPPPPAQAGQPAASATMPAAAAPPAPRPTAAEQPVAPPARAPVKPVQSAPLGAPAPLPPAAQAAPAPGPALPTAPPPPAAVAGGPSAPPAPPPPNPMPAPASSTATTLEFPRGSAALSPQASDAVKRFAAQRGRATVLVTGYGDAESGDPAAQTVALSLGLSRAQAVANALTADGVPAGAVRVSAEASGRGVAMRLLQ
jgi:outer membrane protein OmpA-like peptidoglycan-associated protein